MEKGNKKQVVIHEQHELIRTTAHIGKYESGYRCDNCNVWFETVFASDAVVSWRCYACGFDLCDKCVELFTVEDPVAAKRGQEWKKRQEKDQKRPPREEQPAQKRPRQGKDDDDDQSRKPRKIANAKMFHPLNGRNLFAKCPTQFSLDRISLPITPMLLASMLRREEELRKSPDVLARYAALSQKGEDDKQVTIDVQNQVLNEFGCADLEKGWNLIRGAESYFPDFDFKPYSMYRKFNRAQQSSVAQGGMVQDVPFFDPQSAKMTSLFTKLNENNQSDVALISAGSSS